MFEIKFVKSTDFLIFDTQFQKNPIFSGQKNFQRDILLKFKNKICADFTKKTCFVILL